MKVDDGASCIGEGILEKMKVDVVPLPVSVGESR